MDRGTVAIITDKPGWHEKQLAAALAHHGLHSIYVSLTSCLLQVGEGKTKITLGNHQDSLIGLFIRGIPAGTLEQLIFRLNILHTLAQSGTIVYNNPRAIEHTVDKPFTSFMLAAAGLLTPKTWICESVEKARAILQQNTGNGQKLVQKPLFGSQGIGIHLVDQESDLMHDEKFAGVYYLQRFIHSPNAGYFDIRVLVIDGKARAAMKRSSKNWLTNRAQGAQCAPIVLDRHTTTIAERAADVLGADYAGVDLIVDEKGSVYVLEVNSIPAWYGLQKTTDFNIAVALISAFVEKIAVDIGADRQRS